MAEFSVHHLAYLTRALDNLSRGIAQREGMGAIDIALSHLSQLNSVASSKEANSADVVPEVNPSSAPATEPKSKARKRVRAVVHGRQAQRFFEELPWERALSPVTVTNESDSNSADTATEVTRSTTSVHVSPKTDVDAQAVSPANNILVAGAVQAIRTAKLLANAERGAAVKDVAVSSQKFFNALPWG